MARKRPTGSSKSWRGDARLRSDGRPMSRNESWARAKAPGEAWPRFAAEVPPELAEALDDAQRKSLGVNATPTNATRANMVRAALRLYLDQADPEAPWAIEADAEEIVDAEEIPE